MAGAKIMFGRLKIRKADSEYSKWLRKSRNYTCERCGKYEEGIYEILHIHRNDLQLG